MGQEKARAVSEHMVGRLPRSGTGKTQLMEQPQILSRKRQGKHKLGKQKQEMEGLEHLQTCSDVPAPWSCRRYNNAALYGMEVPP